MSQPIVKLTASEARSIQADLLSAAAMMGNGSSAMKDIAAGMATYGMQSLSGMEVARKQEEIDTKAQALVRLSIDRANGLGEYAAAIEATQEEAAAEVRATQA